MTTLQLDTYTMPAARLWPDNPLPPLHAYRTVSIAETSDAAAADYPDRGNESAILPYCLQDHYGRSRQPWGFKAAVLENDLLRATFLLTLGGRLWSLFDKRAGRELLHVNPVFQPANLAVRDAWFSGGVEWNISVIGHCPFTCAPLFAARVIGADGQPFLRLYEFERIRGVPFQIDIHLPPGSPYLLVRPRIDNPNPHAVPMYWWSNIAVDETPDMRVLAPAASAHYHAYDRTLRSQDLPHRDGQDVTYPTRRASAADLYFRIDRDRRPWIAALDRDGRGLIHTSTQRLIGRKMFLWGTDPGGRRWMEHLSEPNRPYIEIQGGLATTQTEYVAMPPGARWEWLEAYGAFETDAAAVHGPWESATRHVEAALEQALPRATVDAYFEQFKADADRPAAEMLQAGSGWGALEQRRRARRGLPPMALTFPEPTADETELWRRLLEDGALPEADEPGAYMTQPEWRQLLEDAVAAGRGDHWLSWLHLGVMRYRAGELAAAKAAWERSMALRPSAVAQRNLAVLAGDKGDAARSAEMLAAAARMDPSSTPIAIEACEAALSAGQHAAARQLIASLPVAVRENGRIRLLDAIAALRAGDLATVAAYFDRPCDIANIREGELSLSQLWFEWHEARLAQEVGRAVDDAIRKRARREHPLPTAFDFRMTRDPLEC